MQRRTHHRISTQAALGTLTILTAVVFGGASNGHAQVVIDMPPPRPQPRVAAPPPPAPPDAATQATVLAAPAPPRIDPQPGALAFHQYARTRYLPEDRFGLRRHRQPFTPGHFTHSFTKWGLHAPFHVITPAQVIIVQPPVLIKPPMFPSLPGK